MSYHIPAYDRDCEKCNGICKQEPPPTMNPVDETEESEEERTFFGSKELENMA
jgi:hypothetical protein